MAEGHQRRPCSRIGGSPVDIPDEQNEIHVAASTLAKVDHRLIYHQQGGYRIAGIAKFYLVQHPSHLSTASLDYITD